MSGISLTASMRSNLLSLQNIASQQDIVQNRLATGLKVSSAIDNPSSYYTASSLNNRASDLSALLDAMSQGIQTIKAASEAIDSGTKFLEQAKAVANKALETAIPAKEWFAEQAGENGTVVATAQELLDAVNAGKEMIVVYGKIELINQTIQLQKNQKLVGTEYFTQTDSDDSKRFSQITFQNTDINIETHLELSGNNLVSDLDFKFRLQGNATSNGILAGRQNNMIQDITIQADAAGKTVQFSAIQILHQYASELTLAGNIDIEASAQSSAYAIYNFSGTLHIAADSKLNLSADSRGFINYGKTDIASGALLYIKAPQAIRNGSDLVGNSSILNIASGVKIFAESSTLFRQEAPRNGAESIINLAGGVELSLNNTNSKYAGSWKTKAAETLTAFAYFNETKFNADNNFIKQDYQAIPSEHKTQDGQESNRQYLLILKQYDMLISDAFYKGINLLDGHNLKINFNEDRSSKIDVAGVKADSDSLGVKTREWNSSEDIEQSVSELEEAINSLRNFASQFGNYYSIVTTRQNFTENLINVLEEGSDKLTLADMNQESADMLALQTSQQLAVNPLSLASQSSQAALKLF